MIQLVNLVHQAQLNLLAEDFALFASSIEQQSYVCTQLLSLEAEGANSPSNKANHAMSTEISLDSGSLVDHDDCYVACDFPSLRKEIESVRTRLRHANIVQAALLQHAGRRVRAISNCAGKTSTYNIPSAANEALRGE